MRDRPIELTSGGSDGRRRAAVRGRLVVALAALLVGVVAGGSVASAHPFLTTYRWVTPPAGAPATEAPVGRTVEIPASATEVLATEVWTGDLQAVLDLVDTTVPADAGRAVAVAELEPLDPAGLGPLPRSLVPAGNAYAVRVSDTGGAALPIAAPSRILLATAHPGARVLFSADGATWSEVAVDDAVPTQVTAAFVGAGYYLPAVAHDAAATAGPGQEGVPTVVVGLGMGGAALLWLGAARLGRR